MYLLVWRILAYCNPWNILIRDRYILRCLNVIANNLSRRDKSNPYRMVLTSLKGSRQFASLVRINDRLYMQVCRILVYCNPWNILIWARYIQGCPNVIAFCLSRKDKVILMGWSLHLKMFHLICIVWQKPMVEISDLNGYPDIRVPEPWILTRIRHLIPEYPNLSLFLLISPTLADQVQTYLDFINSFKNETIQLKCTIILFSHPCTPFIVFYLSFILVVYTLSNHRNPLKIVSISKQLLNSESIKRCILAI